MPESTELGRVQYFKVANKDELKTGERLFVEIGDFKIVVFNIGGFYFAIGDVCTHDDGPLGDGDLDGFEVVCPRHGARFDLRDGKATRRPAIRPIPSYPVRVIDDCIEVGIPIG